MLIQRSNPNARLARLLDGPAPVLLHADDLPHTDTFSTWPGRGKISGTVVNGAGVNSPLSAKSGWGGRGYAGLRAAHLRPSTSQHVTFSAAAAAYGASTPFTWAFAVRMRGIAAQRNVLFLGSSSNGNNWRGFYQPSGGNFGLLSNRNGAGAELTNGSVGTVGEQAIIGISFDAGGNFLIKQLLATGEETLADTTHPVGGTLTANRFSLGCAILNNAVSSQCALFARFLVCQPGVALDEEYLSRLLVHIRDQQGCPLPTVEPSNVLISIPSGVQRWANSKLQVTATPGIDDWSPNGVAGNSSGVSITDQAFDFGGVATSWMTAGGYQIPADNSPFTLTASVERVSGRSWDTGTNYNLVSDNNLRVTMLISGGLLKYHYAGTLYSSGYDAHALWASGKRHRVALRYEAGTLRAYVDDAVTPVATHTGLTSRPGAAGMNFGAFNLTTGSWQHKATDFAIYNTALSDADLERHWRVAAAQTYNLVVDGDSNLAQVGKDFLAPCGEVGIWDQARRYVFPRAGLKTTFLANNAQSGRMWDTAGGFAPTSMIAGGAALDALVTTARKNIVTGLCLTNDVHQVLYGGDTAPLMAAVETWANARRASGKYVAIGCMQAPPAQNSTYNGRINTCNAALLTLRGTGVLDFVVERHADLSDPLDGLHWLPKVGVNDPEHFNGLGAKKMALQWRDAILNGVPFHD